MQRLEANDAETQSTDVLAENIARLRELFPELITEGPDGQVVNVDVLKQLVGDSTVSDTDEKYGLTWHGKRRARQIALTPSTGTLRPCPEESLDWDTTQNLMIEGDNLEVLKLLQKSYSGKVKLIYIDPPYNTGHDFVYPDDFRDTIKRYKEISGQLVDGQKVTTNSEASGRYHTDWLSMLYPRIKLARNLLQEDGVLFISINDVEASNLRNLCDEVFGDECFIAQIVWKSRVSEDTRAKTGISTDHEYLLAYGRSDSATLRGVEKDLSKFDNPDDDPRGPWRSADLTGLASKSARPNLHYDLIDPNTDVNYGCPPKGWRFEQSTMCQKIAEGRILFPDNSSGRPRHKLFVNEMKSMFKNMSSVIAGRFSTSDGTREINDLLGAGVFSFPKPTQLIATLVEQVAGEGDMVLDFFAGSGTSGHAVWKQSLSDSINRRFVLVQLPEILDTGNRDQQIAADLCLSLDHPANIAELTKERLRRSAQKLRSENPDYIGDLGFRVFKLDGTNIREWEPDRDNLDESLHEAVEHLKPGRTEDDVLYEVLLKLGLDLCVPMVEREIGGIRVHNVGAGTLFVCLPEEVSRDDAETLALGIVEWHQELNPAGDTTCVFRDSAFADDVAKSNLAAILQQYGIKNVRSL